MSGRARQRSRRRRATRDTLQRREALREGTRGSGIRIASPASETVAPIASQPVVDQVQERRRITLAEERAGFVNRTPDDIALRSQLLRALTRRHAEVVEDVSAHHLFAVAPNSIERTERTSL